MSAPEYDQEMDHPPWLRKLDRKFLLSLARLQLPAGPWIVAVSGGADSIALAHLLFRHHREPLLVAHFDHELRGTESTEDARFVKNWVAIQAHRFTMRVGHGAHHEQHQAVLGKPEQLLKGLEGNLEANARKARYRWLVELAERHQATCVFTAHHADDQAETILFRLMRGTGIRGMAGMAPKRTLAPGLALARPLLEFSKSLLLDYLGFFDLKYRTDSSNEQLDFARNRIRQKVLPILGEVMGDRAIDRIASFAWHGRHLDLTIANACKRWKERHLKHASTTEIVLELRGLRKRSAFWLAQFLGQLWKDNGWPSQAMTREHWLALVEQARCGPSRMSLPGKIMSHRQVKKGLLLLTREPQTQGDR